MTKALPRPNVQINARRLGPARLLAPERQAIDSVADPALRKIIGEVLLTSRANQQNFDEIREWFPIQPEDMADSQRLDLNAAQGIPFTDVVWCEVNGEAPGEVFRGGEGLLFERLSKGVYRILVEEGFGFWTEAEEEKGLPYKSDFIAVVPRTAGAQAVAADVNPVAVSGVGSGWDVRLFSNVAASTPVDSVFYLFAGNFTDDSGQTIKGPEGPEGPTHKALYHGEGPPFAEFGEVDDFYIDTLVPAIYGPKTEAGWGEAISLVGPKGDTGEKGATGEKGPKGDTGAKGEKGEKGEKGDTGAAGEKGAAGAEGAKGATGAEGRWASLKYKYLTNTEETEPAAGGLKLNAGKTGLFISETDGDGGGISAYLAAWDDSTTTGTRGFIVLRKVGTPATFAVYKVTGALVDKGAWDSLPVSLVVSNGAFANEDVISVEFYRTGDKGEQGEKGATGEKGEKGATGEKGEKGSAGAEGAQGPGVFVFNGSGVFEKLNEAGAQTIRRNKEKWKEVTEIGISNEAVSFSTATQTLERLSIGATIIIYDKASPGSHAVFRIKEFAFNKLKNAQVLVVELIESAGTETFGKTEANQLVVSFLSPKDWGIVSSLPTTPRVGDRCAYVAAAGVLWNLIYDGEGEFPWKFVGGAPLFNETPAQEGTTSAEYKDLATVGPSLTIPLKGDYDVEIGAQMYNNTANCHARMSYAIGATAASDSDFMDKNESTGGAFGLAHGTRMRRKTGLAAATKLTAKYKQASGGEASFVDRYMKLAPVRVG